MKGIFTLGENEQETLEKIDAAKTKITEIQAEIIRHQGTLGPEDNSSGKRGDLKALREDFEGECWKIKGRHDDYFKNAFTGARNSQAKFCDKLLEELAANKADIVDLLSLKSRAATLFQQELERFPSVPLPDPRDLITSESNAVLAKKVVGKEDIDVAALIRRLGNSDWVRQGINYLEKDGPCPFCQQSVPNELADKLNAYFDETFLADMARIDQIVTHYKVHSEDLVGILGEILANNGRHLDCEKFQAELDRLSSRLEANNRLLENKKKEPSTPVSLQPIADLVSSLTTQIEAANTAIASHNALVDNHAAEETRLIAEIWKCLLEENKDTINKYSRSKSGLDKAVNSLVAQITASEARLATAKAELHTLEKSITSVQPTVDEINGLLSQFGFTGFKLKTAGEKNHLYEIVRDDGGNATETLSEGERSFVSFLYFYQMLRGSLTETGASADRVVVFDDPVSSLDSDVLFIVSALIKRIIKEASEQKGQIKQVFVLTHNVYFHKEVSFDAKRGKEPRHFETFWVVRKPGGVSEIKNYNTNPIKTSYELLWEEARNPNKTTIQNALRRIVENYFKILGSIDPDEIVAKFKGKEQQVCASLLAWVNEGSHSVHDDIFVALDEDMVERYLSVFKQIFEKTDHAAHYWMMMKADPGKNASQIPVAAPQKDSINKPAAQATG
jgi:wobble nucleotide-excising tRNase